MKNRVIKNLVLPFQTTLPVCVLTEHDLSKSTSTVLEIADPSKFRFAVSLKLKGEHSSFLIDGKFDLKKRTNILN